MAAPTTALEPAVEGLLDRATFERAWQGSPSGRVVMAPPVKSAQLTILRNTKDDFQDRPVFLFVDGEAWGKVKYGVPMTRDIAPGKHSVRAFNTLFSHTIEIEAGAGEHVRLRCSNGMPTAGWLMMIFLHVTALCVKLEQLPIVN
jgi:hypothetical protein